MKRLYFLTNNMRSLTHFSDLVHRVGIRDNHFHVASNNDAALATNRIHPIPSLFKSDLIHSGERGALIGLLLAAALILAANISGFVDIIGAAGLTAMAFILFMFCTWEGGMWGIQHANYKIARFKDDIDNGKHLVMVDIAPDQITPLCNAARKIPYLQLAGEGSTFIHPLQDDEAAA